MKYFIGIALSVFILFACNKDGSKDNSTENAQITQEIEQIDSMTNVMEGIQVEIEQSTQAVDAALSELDF